MKLYETIVFTTWYLYTCCVLLCRLGLTWCYPCCGGGGDWLWCSTLRCWICSGWLHYGEKITITLVHPIENHANVLNFI